MATAVFRSGTLYRGAISAHVPELRMRAYWHEAWCELLLFIFLTIKMEPMNEAAGLPQPPLLLFFLSLFLSFVFSLADLILSFMSKSTNYGRN